SQAREGVALRPADPLLKKQTARLLLRTARRALVEHHLPQAISLAEQSLGLDPDWLAPYLLLQRALRLSARHRMAARRLEEMASLFPGSYPVLLLLAERRLDQGGWKAAEALLERARATGYRSSDLELDLARVAFNRREKNKGRRLVGRGLALADDGGVALAHIGSALAVDGLNNLAEEYLTRAMSKGRERPDILGHLGELAMRRRDFTEAIGYFRRALAARPGSARWQLDLGNCLLLSGRAAEALRPLREAQRLTPGNPRVHLNLAVALLHEGRREEARAQLLRVGDALPNNQAVRDLRRKLNSPDGGF
ncbi:MAG: tetratricopeptide repeat protein, partial [Acidobacteriota bacterium]